MSEPAAACPPPSTATNVRWLVFAAACGTSFLLYLHRYSWNIIGPALQREHDFSNTQTAVLFSLFYYTYAAGQIPSGVVVDRYGPRRFLTVAIAAWSLALAGLATTANILWLGWWRLLFGAAQAGCYPALTKVSQLWFPSPRRTVLQGWVATTFGRAGGAVSPIVMGTLLIGAWSLSWQAALIAVSLLGVVHGAVFWAVLRNTPEEDPRVNAAERRLLAPPPDAGRPGSTAARRDLPLGAALRNRSLRYFIAQQFLDAGSDVVFVGLLGSYFLAAHGLQMQQTGWLASLPLWGGALGGVAGGWLNDALLRRIGPRWARSGVGFAGKAIGCGLLFVVSLQTSGLAAAWWLMAAKFFSDWSQPTTWGACTDLGGRLSATVFSIVNTAGTLGGVCMPIVFGLLLDGFTTTRVVDGETVAKTDWDPLFLLLAAMYFGSGLCWFMVDCTDRLEPAADTPQLDSPAS